MVGLLPPVDHQRLSRVLARFAATLVEVFDLDEVLERLGEDVAGVVGADGAGVMVEDENGDLRFISISDPVLVELERLQIQTGEGPCLDAYRRSEIIAVPDLAQSAGYSRFAPAALEAGMSAVYSFPLRFEDQTIGALNLYCAHPCVLADEHLEACRTLADIATIFLLHSRDVEASRQLTAQLQQALGTRITVEQAKGFVAARLGIGVDDARDLLRGHARRQQRRLRDVATEVLAGELDPRDLRT